MAEFFSEQVKHYGGKTRETTFDLDMKWWAKSDTNGFQILFDKRYIPAFQKYLAGEFGNYELRDKYPQIVYSSKDVGVRILCDLGSNPTHVICLTSNSP